MVFFADTKRTQVAKCDHMLKIFYSRLFLIVDKFPNQQNKSEVTFHNSIQRCGLLTIYNQN